MEKPKNSSYIALTSFLSHIAHIVLVRSHYSHSSPNKHDDSDSLAQIDKPLQLIAAQYLDGEPEAQQISPINNNIR